MCQSRNSNESIIEQGTLSYETYFMRIKSVTRDHASDYYSKLPETCLTIFPITKHINI